MNRTEVFISIDGNKTTIEELVDLIDKVNGYYDGDRHAVVIPHETRGCR